MDAVLDRRKKEERLEMLSKCSALAFCIEIVWILVLIAAFGRMSLLDKIFCACGIAVAFVLLALLIKSAYSIWKTLAQPEEQDHTPLLLS